jgi:two-component system, sensor histidine kinase and response regulator
VTGSPRMDLRGLKVLVVDDNETNRMVLTAYAGSWQMRTTAVSDGDDAISLMHTAAEAGEPFDVALLDFNMPGMNGLELADKIKQAPSLRATRLLMLTSSGPEHSEARASGVGGVLTKPVRQSRLLDAIGTVMRRPVASPGPERRTLAPAHTLVPILIAEDQDANRLLLVRQLERRGYRVHVARDGREALEAMKRGQISLTLMDCQMPELDGYEATRRFREHEAATGDGRLPIIAMTANALEGDRERCLEAGMDDYLSKPLRPSELEVALDRWLATRPGGEIAATAGQLQRAAQALDAERIAMLADGIGHEELEELLELFVHSAEDEVDAVAAAIQAPDGDAVASHAHALRGLALNYGATQLAAAADALEQAARDGAALEPALDVVQAAWPVTLEAMQLAVRERTHARPPGRPA